MDTSELIMLNLASKEERNKWNKHGEYKGQIYKNSDNLLFVESSYAEAKIICEVSGKQVFCTENFTMLYKHKVKERRKDIRQRRKLIMFSMAKSVIKKVLYFFK